MSAPATAPATPPSASASSGTRPGNAPATRTAQPPAGRTSDGRRRVATPRALRWWTFGTALACAVFALTTLLTMSTAANSATRASDDAEQLIRVQTIRANLLRADALATNAFLAGGLEEAGQRQAYDAALDETTVLIAHAAAAQPADRDALAELNTAVAGYAAAMEQARANNRQGFPVGAAYLTKASQELRSTALPILDNLVGANEMRASQQLGSLDNAWFEVVGLACLVVLLVAMVWVARRFHRVVNVGMLLAALLVLATWIVGGALLASARTTAADVRNGDLRTISVVGQARAAANEAKVQESLRLIAQGSGKSHEQAWQESSDTVDQLTEGLTGDAAQLGNRWQAYATAHQAVVTLDDKGEWDKAVKQATADSEKSPNATFAAFDKLAAEVLEAHGDEVRRSTDDRSWAPFVLMVVGVPVLVVAGVSAGVGLRMRLREYL